MAARGAAHRLCCGRQHMLWALFPPAPPLPRTAAGPCKRQAVSELPCGAQCAVRRSSKLPSLHVMGSAPGRQILERAFAHGCNGSTCASSPLSDDTRCVSKAESLRCSASAGKQDLERWQRAVPSWFERRGSESAASLFKYNLSLRH